MRKLTVTLLIALASATFVWADAKDIDDAVRKAGEQMQKGKTEDALKTVHKLLSKDPSPEAQIAGGRLLMQLGKRDEAGTAFQSAVAAATEPHAKAEALAALAEYELTRASSSDALTHAKAAVQEEGSATTLAVLAMAQARAGDPTTAKTTADRAVASAASSALAQDAEGEALLALGKPKEAVAALRKAVQLDPHNPTLKVALARGLLEADQAKEAVGVARAVVEAYPNDAEAHGVLGLALLATTPNGWGAAIAEAQQGAFLDPKSPTVQYEVGQIFEAGGNLDQAIASYQKALDVDPQFGAAAHAKILAAFRKGDVDGALATARKMADAAPNSGEVQLTLGELLVRKEDYSGAVPVLEKATKLLPNNGEAFYFLAQAYYRSGHPLEDLVEPLTRAVKLEPDQLEYRALLGLALGAKGDKAAGIEQLKKVVASPDYKSSEAWINLGYLYRTIDPRQLDNSVAAYRKALTFDPKDIRAHVGLGWAYYYQQKWDQSIAEFQAAAKIDPGFEPEAAVRVAWNTYRRDLPKKDFAAMDAAYQRAAKLAGADLSSLQKLNGAIQAAKKGAAEAAVEDVEVNVAALVRVLNSSASPERKIKAVQELRDAGSEGAIYIASTALRGGNINVRLAALKVLGAIGRAACDPRALRELKVLQGLDLPTPSPDADRATMELELREGDLIRNARTLYQKLMGICR